jgi:hypothetical protein
MGKRREKALQVSVKDGYSTKEDTDQVSSALLEWLQR